MDELIAPQGDPNPNLETKWKNWVTDPVNRASLIQAGIALLQPMAPGQMPLGHIANAIGEGGALRGRYQEEMIAEQERAMKRQAEALAARETEARIANYGADNDMARKRLALTEEEIANAREGRVWGRQDAAANRELTKLRIQNETEQLKRTKAGNPSFSEILSGKKYEDEARAAKPKAIEAIAKATAESDLTGKRTMDQLLADPQWYAEQSRLYDERYGLTAAPAAPGAPGTPPAPGASGTLGTYKGTPVTESDIGRFMAATGYTREQVLQILKENP